MRELENEHIYARTIVRELSEAKDQWMRGSGKALDAVKENLLKLIELCPTHIKKEDKQFFFHPRNISRKKS